MEAHVQPGASQIDIGEYHSSALRYTTTRMADATQSATLGPSHPDTNVRCTRISMEMMRRLRKTQGYIFLSGAGFAGWAVCGVGAQQQHPGRAPCARGVAAEAPFE